MTITEKISEATQFLANEVMEKGCDVINDLIANPNAENVVVEDLINDIAVMQLPHDTSLDELSTDVYIEKFNPFDYADGIVINVAKEVEIENNTCVLRSQIEIKPEV